MAYCTVTVFSDAALRVTAVVRTTAFSFGMVVSAIEIVGALSLSVMVSTVSYTHLTLPTILLV